MFRRKVYDLIERLETLVPDHVAELRENWRAAKASSAEERETPPADPLMARLDRAEEKVAALWVGMLLGSCGLGWLAGNVNLDVIRLTAAYCSLGFLGATAALVAVSWIWFAVERGVIEPARSRVVPCGTRTEAPERQAA